MQELAQVKAAVAMARATVERFDTFATDVTAGSGTGVPRIVAAALQAQLHGESQDRLTHVLYVAVTAAGGETITRRHGLTLRPRITFAGGCQVSHLLLDVSTGVVRGGTAPWVATLEYNVKDRSVTPARVTRLIAAQPTK